MGVSILSAGQNTDGFKPPTDFVSKLRPRYISTKWLYEGGGEERERERDRERERAREKEIHRETERERESERKNMACA